MSKARLSVMEHLDGGGATLGISVPGRAFASTVNVCLGPSEAEETIRALEIRRHYAVRDDAKRFSRWVHLKDALMRFDLIGDRIWVTLNEHFGADSKLAVSMYISADDAEEAADELRRMMERGMTG